jgi:hypothetical protein
VSAPAYRLLWDSARDATAWRSPLWFALALAGLAAARAAWGAWRGGARADAFSAMLLLGAALAGASAAALAREQRRLADPAGRRTVEGVIAGVWHDVTHYRDGDNEVRRAYWEGFDVAGVPFVYDEDERDNFWRNRPEQGGKLGEGARVRLQYVERLVGGRARRRIVRVEVAAAR